VPKASRPNATGQIAIRGQLEVCPNPRSELGQEITVWCGSGQHVVGYPIRSGKLYGLVLIQDAAEWSLDQSWSTPWPAIRLSQLFGESNNLLRGFLESVDDWRAWPLWASEPLTGPDQLAFRHTALIGDAGHAMRPHLAQGAAMGIEDAWVLAHELRRLGSHESGIAGLENQPLAATHYANQRWQRIATVQQRAQRSGKIFQLRGPMALARNMALRAAGPQLMDQPWLYGHGLLGHATDVVL
jgi:salicylate hydroxylase